MSETEQVTRELLERWYGGDKAALAELLGRNLPWLEQRVRNRLGTHLRSKAETVDYVQETTVELLRYKPKFVVANQNQFRALVGRIVENVLRDSSDRWSAKCRAKDREQGIPRDSILELDPSRNPIERPSEIAQRREGVEWVQLGMRLLDPESRALIQLRQIDDLPFAEVGRRLEISEDAARMRFSRSLAALARKMRLLHIGQAEASADE